MAAIGPGSPQTIDLDTLSNADLSSLKEQFDEELQALIRSSLALQRAAGELGSSGRAAERLASQPEGQALLLPLTASVYVAGELTSNSSALVDIGTGYYVEQPVTSATAYFGRKVAYLKDQLNQLSAAVKDKQLVLHKVNSALQRRMAQAQRTQAVM